MLYFSKCLIFGFVVTIEPFGTIINKTNSLRKIVNFQVTLKQIIISIDKYYFQEIKLMVIAWLHDSQKLQMF